MNEHTRGATGPAAADSLRKDPVGDLWRRFLAWAGGLEPGTLAWGGLGLAAVLMLAANTIASTAMKHISADLTAEKLFTISDGTRKVLSSIDEPIKTRVYFSKALGEAAPNYQKYFDRVRALLTQYRDISGGRLDLEFIDPEAFSDAEDRAVAAGLKGIRLNREGETGYFGLVATNSTDHRSLIEFFAPERERFLEYDLSKLIYGLANPKKRIVGLISTLPLEGTFNPRGGMVPPWMVLEQMRDFYDVKTISPDSKEIPADVDMLMLVQPDTLTEDGLYAIDQFALKGGRILAFIDPVAKSAGRGNPMQMMQAGGKSGLDKLLTAWGVQFSKDKAAGDIRNARKVQFGGGPGQQPVVADYVAWISLNKTALDDKDPLSAGIDRLMFGSPGFLEKAEAATTAFLPLIRTSKDAAELPADMMRMQPDPLGLLKSYKSLGKPLVLAARVTGEIKSAFPDGAPKPKKDDEKKDELPNDAAAKPAEAPKAEAAKVEPAKASLKSGNLSAIIVADTDMLADQFWAEVRDFLGQRVVTPTAHNAVFTLNALDNLSGSDTMMTLRGRGIDDRPFERVEKIRRDAETRFREKEQGLQAKLKGVQEQLSSIETKGDGNVILSEKDRQAIDRFRGEMVGVRRELRDVKLELRKDIDRLDGTLKLVNIAGVPILIGLGALLFNYLRRRRTMTAA